MNIEEFFKSHNYSSVIFDPVPSYSGDWIFTIDNLIRCSKKEEGVNLFQEFYKKTYCEPLKKIFKTERILDLKVGMISTPNEDNIGRCLKYSKIDFFYEMTIYLNQHIDRHGKTKDEHYEYLDSLLIHLKDDNDILNMAYVEALNEKLKKLKDVLDKEINSEYFEDAMKDYAYYKNSMDFTTFINKAYNVTKDFHNGMMNLGNFFDNKVDYTKIYECFDPDIFYLMFAKIIYEFSLIREKETGKLDNSYGYLHYYNNAVGEVSKSEKKYDPKIKFILPSGKRIRYSRYQFQQEFKELMNRHPEAKSITLPNLDNDNNNKYKDIELIEKLSEIYSEETKVNWEFLPEGEKIKQSVIIGKRENSNIIKKDKEELVNETNMRINILENSGFIGRPVKGLNTFSGYYAFIYPNGKVILEKFWENEEHMTPSIGCATYVMDIDNFVEMSKLSRLNLIEYIKTLPEVGVKRIFHTSVNNWHRNLSDEIEGSYRLEDAIEFINGLKTGAVTNEK